MATPGSETRTALPALGLRTAAFAIGCIVMMVVDYRGNSLDLVRRTLAAAMNPIQVAVSLPVRLADWGEQSTRSRADLERENNALKVERLRTRAELQRFNALEAENERLRAMLNASARVADDYSMAEIMAVDANPYRHSIRLNKGIRRGVSTGQALVDANGVVGQVLEATDFNAMAILITDPDHATPVQVARNGLRTIADGTGELDRLELSYLPNSADIEVGDLLVTSGLGGTFPPGYPVAEVVKLERRPDLPFATVSARPVAKLDRIREVVLIRRDLPVTSDTVEPEDPTNAEH
ncbi:MAG: rod shape-determining protein MreC [Pseudomonadota bacterium]